MKKKKTKQTSKISNKMKISIISAIIAILFFIFYLIISQTNPELAKVFEGFFEESNTDTTEIVNNNQDSENKQNDNITIKAQGFYISTIEELNSCHILFVSDSFKNRIEDILNATRKHPILTIGETKGFAKKGVLINFYIEQNKIRFEMNKNSFKDSGLKVSHLLLKIAKIV